MCADNGREEREMLAFVLMPFDPEFDGIYRDLIVPALKGAGYEVRRADSGVDQQSILQQSILKDIIDNIARADLIVAELSSLNGNVMYELGIAHGLLKPTVMLTQDIAAVPFDLRSYRLITYSLNYSEVGKLQRQLEEIAQAHRAGAVTFGNPVSDFAPRDLRRHGDDGWQLAQGVATAPAMAITVASATSPVPTQAEEEPGIFDIQEDIERSQQGLKEYMDRLTDISKGFEAGVAPHVREMGTLAGTPGIAARKRELVRSVAAEITKFAQAVEAELPGLRDAWRRFGESSDKAARVSTIVSATDRDAARGLIVGATEFGQSIQGTLAQVTEVRGSLAQLRGISKDLNRAIHQGEQAFDGVIEALTIGSSYATRIAGVVAERLEGPGH